MSTPAEAGSLKRMMRRLAALLGVAGVAATQAAPIPPEVLVARNALEARVAAVREALQRSAQEPSAKPHDDNGQFVAQWFNWPNWGNWPNWPNWGNWGNWFNR